MIDVVNGVEDVLSVIKLIEIDVRDINDVNRVLIESQTPRSTWLRLNERKLEKVLLMLMAREKK
jgi:hypothetical protein